MTSLQPGDQAPAFTLPDAEGKPVSMSDFAGRRVIVYFYPAALTPGCTTQAVDFTTAEPDLDAAGLSVVGISPDASDKLKRFRDTNSLDVVLLSDPEKTAINAYGAFGERKLYGKTVEGVLRSTFVVNVADDGRGTIELAQYNVKATGHVDRLRRTLGV